MNQDFDFLDLENNLNEEAKTIDSLEEDIHFYIRNGINPKHIDITMSKGMDENNIIGRIFIEKPSGNRQKIKDSTFLKNYLVYQEIYIDLQKLSPEKFKKLVEKAAQDIDHEFSDEFKFYNTKVINLHSDFGKYKNQGYGPFAYDLAIEFATSKGWWSTSTAYFRGVTTIAAQNIWKYYYYRRTDLEMIMMDAVSLSFWDNGNPYDYTRAKVDWPWLFAAYQKSPEILNSKKMKGRIHIYEN